MGRLDCKSCGRRTSGLRDLCLFCQPPEPARPTADQLATAEGGTAVLEAAPPVGSRSIEGAQPSEPAHLAPPFEPALGLEPPEAPELQQPEASEPLNPEAEVIEMTPVPVSAHVPRSSEAPRAEDAPQTGTVAEAAPSVPKARKLVAEFPFFPVSSKKFVAMSLCTFGFYELYWVYKSYQRISQRSEESMRPFWRAMFAPIWSFDLFKRINSHLEEEGMQVAWSSQTLAVIYLVLASTWRLPGAWYLISVFTFLPFLAVINSLSRFHGRMDVLESSNTRFSAANIVGLIFGGLLFALSVLGSFLPE